MKGSLAGQLGSSPKSWQWIWRVLSNHKVTAAKLTAAAESYAMLPSAWPSRSESAHPGAD